ncbi:MAG: NHL repeat-containing protein [Proteobacteria bacterium]|nr:NHL repeat-containing protein [Pseudomonadota bacterium]
MFVAQLSRNLECFRFIATMYSKKFSMAVWKKILTKGLFIDIAEYTSALGKIALFRLPIFSLILNVATLVSCESKLKATLKSGRASADCTNSTKSKTCVSVAITSDSASNVADKEFSASITFSTEITGLEVSDFLLTNTEILALANDSSNPKIYNFKVRPLTANSTLKIQLPANTVINSKGVGNIASNTVERTVTKASTVAVPSLTSVSNIVIPFNSPSPEIALTVSGAEDSFTCTSGFLRMQSSNNTLVLDTSVTWSGTAPNCKAVVTPAANSIGTLSLVFTVVNSVGATSSRTIDAKISSALALGSTSLQYNHYLQDEIRNPISVNIINNKFFVVDRGNARVLIWDKIPTGSLGAASVSIGSVHPGVSGIFTSNLSARNFISPAKTASDGTNLMINDTIGSRILVWNKVPTVSGADANIVIGAPDFSTWTMGTAADQLYWPYSMFFDSSKLFVAEYANRRINSMPTTNGASADVAVGQVNLTTNALATTQTGMKSATDVIVAENKLIVTDVFNHRILIWNSVPTTHGAAANIVLGQANFTSGSANAGGSATASSLSTPGQIYYALGKLFVSDALNHRVLIWNSMPTTNNQPADVVIGQPDFTSSAANQGNTLASSTSFNNPGGILVHAGKLYITDIMNSRILVYNSIPTTNGAAADGVLGKDGFTATGLIARSNSSRLNPVSSHICGTKLFVSDGDRNRVLIWNTLPEAANQAADLVLGQTDFAGLLPNGGGAVSKSSLNNPKGVYCDGTRLFVVDYGNNRVLLWSTIPTTNNDDADFVIGQANSTSSATGLTSSTMNAPHGVWSNGTIVLVADTGNGRVLRWNAIPATDGAAANVVIGQTNMTTASLGGCSAVSLSSPTNINVIGSKLIVADTTRFQVWNTIPSANATSANYTIGQPDLTTCVQGASATTTYNPSGIASDGTKLYLSDSTNNRILVYNAIPTSSGATADSVFGQSDFTTTVANGASDPSGVGFTSENTMGNPVDVKYHGGYLYISDQGNQRLLKVLAP